MSLSPEKQDSGFALTILVKKDRTLNIKSSYVGTPIPDETLVMFIEEWLRCFKKRILKSRGIDLEHTWT